MALSCAPFKSKTTSEFSYGISVNMSPTVMVYGVAGGGRGGDLGVGHRARQVEVDVSVLDSVFVELPQRGIDLQVGAIRLLVKASVVSMRRLV